MSSDELFVFGYDADDHPIHKPVAAMSDDEQVAALGLALKEFQAAEAEIEPLMPLVQVEYQPETLAAAKAILKRLRACETAYERMMRLADAVQAHSAH